jgi:hypothetical protein
MIDIERGKKTPRCCLTKIIQDFFSRLQLNLVLRVVIAVHKVTCQTMLKNSSGEVSEKRYKEGRPMASLRQISDGKRAKDDVWRWL